MRARHVSLSIIGIILAIYGLSTYRAARKRQHLADHIVQCIHLRRDLALSDFYRARTFEERSQLTACATYELEARALEAP